jgi:hypothetical protein
VSGVLDSHVERHGAMPGTKTSGSRETNKRFNNGVDVSSVGLLPGDTKSSHIGAFWAQGSGHQRLPSLER